MCLFAPKWQFKSKILPKSGLLNEGIYGAYLQEHL